MKRITFMIVCFLIVKLLTGQTNFEYNYDNNGNRISRQVVTLKNMQSDENEEEDAVYFIDEEIIKVFPNPTEGFIQISSTNNLDNRTAVIYDLNGRVVLQKNISGTKTDLDLSAEPAGKYLLIIGNESSKHEFIIIKQ